MKRIIALSMAMLILLAAFASCGKGETDPSSQGTQQLTYTDFIGTNKRIAAQMGTIWGQASIDIFKTEPHEYTGIIDMIESLRMGKVDAVLTDANYIKPFVDSGAYPSMDYLYVPAEVFANEVAPMFHTGELRDKYNEWLKIIIADGTLDEMINRWIVGSLPEQEYIPVIELTGGNGTLRVCDTGDYPPYVYYDANNELTGFDTELTRRFAQYMGMTVDTAVMSYEGIIPTVISGKADMSACLYTITEERKQNMIFGDPTIVTQGVLIVKKT